MLSNLNMSPSSCSVAPVIIIDTKTMEPKLTPEALFTPRAYQIDLYEKAVQNNLILYLPTGAGKTYIAIMLLKHLSGDIRKYVALYENISLLALT